MISIVKLFEKKQNLFPLNICIISLQTSFKFPKIKTHLEDKYGEVKVYGDEIQIFIFNNSIYYEACGPYFYLGKNIFGDNSPASLLDKQKKLNSIDDFLKDVAHQITFTGPSDDLRSKNMQYVYDKLYNHQQFTNLNLGDFGFLSLFSFFEINNMVVNNGIGDVKVKQHYIKPLMFNFTEFRIYNDLNSNMQSKIDFK